MTETSSAVVDQFLSPTAPRRGRGGLFSLGLAVGLIVLIFVCWGMLRADGVMVNGGQLTYDRALFLSVNCATLTGFQQQIGFNDFNPQSASGPTIVLVLTIAGSLFALIAGSLAGVRVLRMPFSDAQVIVAAMTVQTLAVLTGTSMLIVNGMALSDCLQQSAAAFGNSGAVFTTAKGHYFPLYASISVQGILLPLAFVGGLGLPVLMDLFYRAIGVTQRLTTHTRLVLTLSATIYLASTGVLFVSEILHTDAGVSGLHYQRYVANESGVDPGQGLRSQWVVASTAALNCRTLGMPFEFLHRFPKCSYWIMVGLMMVGANSAGTGGGLKPTTLWQLYHGFADALRGRPVPRAFGIAGAWAGGYLGFAALSFLAMMALEPQIPTDRMMFLTISALSNVGMTQDTHDPVSIVGPGLLYLGVITLVGRMAPIAVLWWMARTTRDADVLIG